MIYITTRFYCILFFLILITSSCSYNLEENYVKLSQQPTIEVNNALISNQFQSFTNLPDTFPIFATYTYLNYNFELENSESSIVKFFINDNLINESSSLKGYFSIYAPDYSDGFHSLEVHIISNSGTGSLIDKLGYEQVELTINKTITISRVVPKPLQILNAYPKNGRLYIEWETNEDLTAKTIKLEMPLSSYQSKIWEYYIADPYQNHIEDSIFMGGDLKISIENLAIDPLELSPVNSSIYTFQIPQIKQNSNELNSVTVVWDKPLFYQNIDFNKIIHIGNSYVIENPLDTTFTLSEINFASNDRIRLKFYAKNINNYGDQYYKETEAFIHVGEFHPMEMRNTIHASKNTDRGFGTKKDTILIIDKDTILKKAFFPSTYGVGRTNMAISSQGDDFYFSVYHLIYHMDRNGLITEIFDSEKVFGRKISIAKLSLGADRYLHFVDGNYINVVNVTGYMYDILDKQIKYTIKNDDAYERTMSTEQTTNGDYLVEQRPFEVLLYKMSDGMIQSTTIFPSNYEAVFFNKALDENDLIMITSEGEVSIYNIPTNSVVKKQIPDLTPLLNYGQNMYDPVSGNIGIEQSDHYYIIEPYTATMYKNIMINASTGNYKYYNGNLYIRFRKLKL